MFHQIMNHAIKLKSDTELSYMRTYNMFSTELKILDKYIKNVLAKRWIHESQSSADVSILFISKKSDELHLCVDYQDLNIITIKNWYFFFWSVSYLIILMTLLFSWKLISKMSIIIYKFAKKMSERLHFRSDMITMSIL